MMRVIQVRSGPVKIEIQNGGAFEVRADEIFIIPSWQMFRHTFPPGSSREVRGAVFRFQLMDGVDPLMGLRFPRVLSSPEASGLLEITDRLSDCFSTPEPGLADLIGYHRLGLDLLERLLPLSEPINDAQATLAVFARMQPALLMMESNINLRPDTNSLAAACGMSRSSFMSLFSQTYGIAPMQFYRRLRLERAQRFLIATDEPLSVIAQQLGYADQAHFTRDFKAHMHMPPIAYRSAMKLINS